MNRRPLGEVVSELATAVEPGVDAIRVTAVAVDLPVEVVLRREAEELVFLADLPRWRWRSVFDTEPGRLTFVLHRVPVSVEVAA